MADLPIPFSAPMVRGLLREIDKAGSGKTQTRRLANASAEILICRSCGCTEKEWKQGGHPASCEGELEWTPCRRPQYRRGDRLYVREHWRVSSRHDKASPRDLEPRSMTVVFEAGGSIANQGDGKWAPDLYYPEGIPVWLGRFRQAMHMPKWASRITLIVTDVRVQRLQDITAEDAVAEGLIRNPLALKGAADFGCDWTFEGDGRYGSPRSAYAALWDTLNADRALWSENPWVAAYTFKPILGNIDMIGEGA